MKKIFLLTLVISLVITLVACGSSVTQKTDELVFGKTYAVNELFESSNEDVKFSVDQNDITPEKLGEFEVLLNITKNSKTESKPYKFKVVDKTGPTITQTVTDLEVNSNFAVENFVEVTDDVDSIENIQIEVVTSNVQTGTKGQYTVTVSAKDKSLNETQTDIVINVVEPVIKLSIGETVKPVWSGGEAEIKLKDVSFKEEISSTSRNSFKQYISDIKDEKFLVFETNIKNLSGNNIGDADLLDENRKSAYVIFDAKYEYKLRPIDSTSVILSEYWSIQPLKSLDVYSIASIPDELVSKPFEVYFPVNGIRYKYEK